MPILDRIPSPPDPIRAQQYNIANLEIGGIPVAELAPRSYSWGLPEYLNQRNEGACVAHGCTHEALAKPAPVDFRWAKLPDWAPKARQEQQRPGGTTSKAVAQTFAFELYNWCRRNDPWPGENYSGTSAAAGAKGMVAAGLWGEYRWGQTAR